LSEGLAPVLRGNHCGTIMVSLLGETHADDSDTERHTR
jgi:hypothetical protein